MTYRELAAKLVDLDDKQLDSDVSVYLVLSDEYVPGVGYYIISDQEDQDMLDYGHPVISVNF